MDSLQSYRAQYVPRNVTLNFLKIYCPLRVGKVGSLFTLPQNVT